MVAIGGWLSLFLGKENRFGQLLFATLTTAYISDWSNTSAAIDEVSSQFFTFLGGQAGFVIITFILTFLLFPAYPKYAPSVSNAKKRLMQNSKKYIATSRVILGSQILGLK